MLSPTLFEVIAILGLSPTDFQYTPFVKLDDETVFPSFWKVSINEFIVSNQRTGAVTDSKHVAFLWCRLTYFVVCCKTMQMPRYFLPVAQYINEGQAISLGSLILAHLYEGLTEAIKNMRNKGEIGILKGPFWFL